MTDTSIYRDIAARTDGDIYIGIVGPVRTGKSTFIKKFMEALVLPNIKGELRRERAVDELPQSAAGRTIMTTEPKFIPEEAVTISADDTASFSVRLIDCVGYIVPSALGYIENEAPRMVMTPWFDDEIPFNMAAEIGTKKVILEHSTIGLVVTTDGSITDIPREEYEEAEERVIAELRGIRKPFAVVLNSMYPTAMETRNLAEELKGRYGVPVIPINCLDMDESDIRDILARVIREFPVREIAVDMPRWIVTLPREHWLKKSVFAAVADSARDIVRIREIESRMARATDCEYILSVSVRKVDLGTGRADVLIEMEKHLLYRILGEYTGLDIKDESEILPSMIELAGIKKKFAKISSALEQVEATGYGIVMPDIEELTLEDPEIVRHSGRYGVRLRASAPSIHIERIERQLQIRQKHLSCRRGVASRINY